MTSSLQLGRYSVGLGDRFEHEAIAQLRACVMASELGVDVTPVWNKSHREHTIIGSEPAGTKRAADLAVRELKWNRPYFVDADHITLESVDAFIPSCDFFTIDITQYIGCSLDRDALEAFLGKHPELATVEKHGQSGPDTRETAGKYLAAAQMAGRIYRHIAAVKGEGQFVTEVSLDEAESPQSPGEMIVILALLSDEAVPVRSIAPRFSGKFHKGIEYIGDPEQFRWRFKAHVETLKWAVRNYGLPEDIKLSLHSGSDKFRLYDPIRQVLAETGAGLHLKTAGTTWLEELLGIVEFDMPGLDLGKEIAVEALDRLDELCGPYRTVIGIEPAKLPGKEQIRNWSAPEFAAALRHQATEKKYNPDFRQLLHIAYRIAAEKKGEFATALKRCRSKIEENVTHNLFERHLKPLFVSR